MITSETIQALKLFLRLCPENPQDAPVEAVNPALADFYRDTFYILEPLDITEAEADNKPLFSVPALHASDEDSKIAKLILNEIHDGSCIQLGIGGMPNTVGMMIAQSDLEDLGVHTEMLCDSFMEMYQAGQVNNSRKRVDTGKMVYTFALKRIPYVDVFVIATGFVLRAIAGATALPLCSVPERKATHAGAAAGLPR